MVELTVFTRKRRRVWNLPLTPGRSVLQYFRCSLSVWAAEHKKEYGTVNFMDTNAESSMRNKIVEYVKQYALITLSISIMSVGVYFFKFPNNFVFGGVTGMAALAAKLTPLSASAFSSAANMILLGVGLIFLGKSLP